MFSGGDSSDGVNSLNQLGAYGFVNQVAVSKAVAAGQNIDWAQLAQQWIQMRDNTGLEAKADANASEYKASDFSCTTYKFEEKGEADMDMDDEEQSDDKVLQRNNDFAPTSSAHNNINQSWFFGEANSQIAPQSTINNQWNAWSNQDTLNQTLPNQNAINTGPVNSTAHIPSLLKINVPHPNDIRVMPDISNQAENTSMMDPAKRKGLPAWIREGLEKMEREKQKQLEKEQKTKDVNSSNEDDTHTNNIVNPITSLTNVPSAQILDEESSDNEEILTNSANSQAQFSLKKDNEKDGNIQSSSGLKSYEEKLADLMVAVRRTLTELLLETTNEEIFKVADETVKIFKSKASSAQVVRKSALSTLTVKLGLAAYGDSSSDNDSDDDRNSSKRTSAQSESENDSEEEIRNTIRLKRRGFTKTSDEIEERVALAAAREEEKLKYFLRKEEEEEKEYSRKKQERSSSAKETSTGHSGHNFKGYEKDFGEITETKIQHLNGKRQKERSSRKERITRFSDNKDKYVTLPNATFLANVNSATNFGSVKSSSTLPTTSQRQHIPDINGLLSNYTSTGMTDALNAADVALEKALKSKASASPEKHSRRTERSRSYKQSKRQRLSESKKSRSRSKSSSSSTTSSSSPSDSASSTSRSSHHSKHKRRTAKKQKSHSSAERQSEKSHKSHRDRRRSSDRKYSSYSHQKKDHESASSRRTHRSTSSDSEDERRRRHRSNSHSSRKSSHTSSYTSSRRDRGRDREHSRSHSRSSYSSNNRRQ